MVGSRDHRDERGAFVAWFVVAVPVFLLLTSMVIDIGATRVVRRDVQGVADVVALDVARQLDGRITSAYPTARFENAKNASLARNQSSFNAINASDVTWQLWVANDNGVPLRQATASDVPNAVKVSARGTAGFRLLPTTPDASPRREAFSVLLPPAACFSVETGAATLTPANRTALAGLLNGLINPSTTVNVLTPAGIANLAASIPLADLAAELGVGSVNELANTTVTARQLNVAAANVLSRNGSTAAASVLNSAAGSINAANSVRIGDLIAFGTGQGQGAGLAVDALSLLTGSLSIANGNRAVTLATGVAGLTATATIIQPPQIACGPVGVQARSAQVSINLRGTVPSTGRLTAGVLQASLGADGLTVNVARATATLNSITCPAGGTGSYAVGVSTGVATLATGPGRPIVLSGLAGIPLLPPLTTVEVSFNPTLNLVASRTGTMTFSPPPFTPQTIGSDVSIGSADLTGRVRQKLLGADVTLLGTVLALVSPALSALDLLLDPVFESLLPALGLRIGTATVTPLTKAVCNQPALRD